MKIKSLGYVGFAAKDLEAWRSFAQDLLGAQICDAKSAGRSKALRLRLDEKCQRMLITESQEDSGPYLGFEVEDKDELARAERARIDCG
jgi:biphenyl-2,3-diol 1,2-dioxygenase